MITTETASELQALGKLLEHGMFADRLVLAIRRHRNGKALSDAGRRALQRLSQRCTVLASTQGPLESASCTRPLGVSYAREMERLVGFVSRTPDFRPNDASWETLRQLAKRLAAAAGAVAAQQPVELEELALLEGFSRAVARFTLEEASAFTTSPAAPRLSLDLPVHHHFR